MHIISEIETTPDDDHAVIEVAFEREITEDEKEILRSNFKRGIIKVDPDVDLPGALTHQLVKELQSACDECGMAGNFLVRNVTIGVRFHDKHFKPIDRESGHSEDVHEARSDHKPRPFTRDQLIARARHFHITTDDLAERLGIAPDRLNNGGIAEVIDLAMADDDPDWIMHQIEEGN